MASVRGVRPSDPSNIQDEFLDHARRERLGVTIQLMNGTDLQGRIRSFDRFAVIVEHDGADEMIFKHAIASIRLPKRVDGAVENPRGR